MTLQEILTFRDIREIHKYFIVKCLMYKLKIAFSLTFEKYKLMKDNKI